MPDGQESAALANPPIAPQQQPTGTPSIFDGLRIRLAPLVATVDTVAGGGVPISKEIGATAQAAKDIVFDPKKRLDFLTGMVGTGGEGELPELEGAAKGLYEGLRIRPAENVMVQPEKTSRATPTGETASLPAEIHADLEKQAGRKLSSDEAVALDRANLERGMVSAPEGDTNTIREQKRSELEKPRKNPETDKSPKEIIENAGLKYKGEVVKGTGVHQFEHPGHPGKTAALKEKDITPSAVKHKMASKLAEFEAGKKLGSSPQ